MQRQLGELVPVAEALADLGGPVQALAKISPQARHHFTQADQVDQLITAREAGPDRGFMARHDGAVLLAPHQPRQPSSVQARQRTLHALHNRRWGQQAPLR